MKKMFVGAVLALAVCAATTVVAQPAPSSAHALSSQTASKPPKGPKPPKPPAPPKPPKK